MTQWIRLLIARLWATRLGQPRALGEEYRVPGVDSLAQDLRYAVRMLLKTPAFTAIVTLSLALGIGANTALFGLVDDLLVRSLPVRDPDRLVKVHYMAEVLGFKKGLLEFPSSVFDAVRTDSRAVSVPIGFGQLDRPAIAIDGTPEPTREVARVSENFFRDLGVAPAAGRTPEASDDGPAVISFRMWNDRFDGSLSVVGRPLDIDGQTYTIVGVAPRRFLGLSIERSTDIWIVPRANLPQEMIARLGPGVGISEAQAELQSIFGGALPPVPGQPRFSVELLPAGKGLSLLRAQYERPLWALSILVTLLLLITCTNVGSLLMVRSTARRRELAVRVALGAGRGRLIRQYFVESILLAALGGALALVFARWGVSILLSMLPLPVPPESLAFQIDARVLGFTTAISLASALLFGLGPAWRATHIDLTALRSIQGNTSTVSSRRLGRVLVACQVGLSMVLLVGAGLFLQTLRNLNRIDVGFNPDRLLQVSIDTRGAGYREGTVGPVFRLLLERIGAIPGVASVTGVRNPVMRHSLSRCRMRFSGVSLASEEPWECADVGPAFFETMGIPVLVGRVFEAGDFERQRGFTVINEAFAKRYFPNADPIAMQIGIIGMVGDVKIAGVRAEPAPMMYHMARREPDRIGALEVRAAGDPRSVASAIRAEVQRVNPRLLIDITTMRQDIDRDMATERMVAATSAFFSLLGVLLVSIGIFGVASYTVANRTTELGIRMALGAGRWSVIGASLRDTMIVFGAGLAAGVAAAVVLVRFTESMMADLLFGLTAMDAANMAGAVGVMIAVACAACLLPARRATKIDPLRAIRCE